jgi:hypothetical protein
LARAEHLQRGVESPSRQRRTLGEGDDHFRSWRDRQIAEYDRDYQAFCRQRQEKFNADFDAWRAQRQARIEMAPTSIQESSGMTTEAVTSGAATTGPRERSRRPSRGRRKP